jgi:hypothetical protein
MSRIDQPQEITNRGCGRRVRRAIHELLSLVFLRAVKVLADEIKKCHALGAGKD